MSKQSEAKLNQGYTDNPRSCSTCANFSFTLELPRWMKNPSYGRAYGDEHKVKKNLRCAIGGFAVKNLGSCTRWEGKNEEALA